MAQLTSANEQLKAKVKQLSAALDTSLKHRHATQSMLLEQSKEIQAKDKDVEELRKKAAEFNSGESRPLLSAAQSK